MAATAPRKTFRLKENSVTLREEVPLTDKQRAKLRNFVVNWNSSCIDVLPTTKIVHKELAERKLDLNICAFITVGTLDDLRVFPLPKHHQGHRCEPRWPPQPKYPWWASYLAFNVYATIEKNLQPITVSREEIRVTFRVPELCV
ncbi:hypothetical protein PMAYCL1PPCAC_10815, partial [Pristionchus mayeri]